MKLWLLRKSLISLLRASLFLFRTSVTLWIIGMWLAGLRVMILRAIREKFLFPKTLGEGGFPASGSWTTCFRSDA